MQKGVVIQLVPQETKTNASHNVPVLVRVGHVRERLQLQVLPILFQGLHVEQMSTALHVGLSGITQTPMIINTVRTSTTVITIHGMGSLRIVRPDLGQQIHVAIQTHLFAHATQIKFQTFVNI